MRVCALTHTYPRYSGDINAPFVEHLMEHIAARGAEVSVLAAYDPLWARTHADHTVDLRTYRYIAPERMHVLGYSRTIAGNVSFKPHVYLLSPFLFAFGYRALMKLVRETRPDILHAHWLLPNGWIAAKVSQATGVPLIVQFHGSDVMTAEKNILFRRMARTAVDTASMVMVPSPEHIERMAAIGVDTTGFRIVPNAVEPSFGADVDAAAVGSLRARLGIAPGGKVVLALGRLVSVKGFDYLVRAFARVAADDPETVLVIAGEGDQRRILSDLAASHGIAERVIMPGAASRDEVPVYFRLADLFVAPSIRHESGATDGLPVVVPEAMAAGTPIVASRVGGIPVVVRDGWNGLLVEERDVNALAAAVGRLLGDPDLRAEFGERSRKIVADRVNYDAISAHVLTLYESITRGVAPEELPEFEM
jgi:glycosyltransferase involved in cell wall biosynthesis